MAEPTVLDDNTPTPIDERLASLRALELFRTLDEALLTKLASSMKRISLAPGETLVRQGERGDAMFVLATGSLRAVVRGADGADVVVGHVKPGQPVGEMQVVVGGTRSATVVADTESKLYRLPRSSLDELAEESPSALASLVAVVRQRMNRARLAVLLPSIVGPLNEEIIDEFDKKTEWVSIRRGEALCKRGEPGDAWYVVASGRVQVAVSDEDGTERVVSEAGPGESIGEIALLTGEPRSASIYASRDTDLVRFSKAHFDEIMLRYPKALMSITQVLIKRVLASNDGRISRKKSSLNIAVIPATHGVPLDLVAGRLAEELGLLGKTLHLSAARLNALGVIENVARIPDDHPNWTRFAAWLDDQSSTYEFVVLEADPQLTGWTQRAVRYADHVLIAADATGDKQPSEIEARLLYNKKEARRPRRTLLLIHPDATRLPSQTAEWLAKRDVDGHQHVRASNAEDAGRVARRLAGRAVGLALGGGGARGFAHLGVYRALREAGIPVDMIGGTSMGSIMSGQIAMGYSLDEIIALNQSVIETKPFTEYTVPMMAMLRSKRVAKSAEICFGETRIEDLWIDFFAIATNLTTAEMVTLDKGSLAYATRASGALPGVVVPVVQRRDLLVDGGIVNNLPADVMRQRGAGSVIAVNVSPDDDLQTPGDLGLPSQWSMFWSRVVPFRTPVKAPTILDIMGRTTVLGSAARMRVAAKSADLFLSPSIAAFGMLEFESMIAIMDAGYRHTSERVAGWTGPRVAPKPTS